MTNLAKQVFAIACTLWMVVSLPWSVAVAANFDDTGVSIVRLGTARQVSHGGLWAQRSADVSRLVRSAERRMNRAFEPSGVRGRPNPTASTIRRALSSPRLTPIRRSLAREGAHPPSSDQPA